MPNKYPVIVLVIYTVVASVGFGCNAAVIYSILNNSHRTPNVRYLLILTVALLLEQIFSFPQIFDSLKSACAASSVLETYFNMMVLVVGVFMALLAYLQIFKGEKSWEWLNSKFVYALILIFPLVAFYPLLEPGGYGIVGKVWCSPILESGKGETWLIIDFVYTYVAIGIMVAVFSVLWYHLRSQDPSVFRNVVFGVGGYVLITIATFLPKVSLLFEQTRATYLIIHILPDISAVFYCLLYFKRRNLLYRYELAAESALKLTSSNPRGDGEGGEDDYDLGGDSSVSIRDSSIDLSFASAGGDFKNNNHDKTNIKSPLHGTRESEETDLERGTDESGTGTGKVTPNSRTKGTSKAKPQDILVANDNQWLETIKRKHQEHGIRQNNNASIDVRTDYTSADIEMESSSSRGRTSAPSQTTDSNVGIGIASVDLSN